jgi:transglutaminase-like putative cysteine protease
VLDRAVARRCLLSTDTGAALLGNVTKDCGDALVEILLDDTLQLTTSSTPPPRRLSSDAFHPDELRQMAEAIGFRGFEWSTEAGLVCDWLKPNPTPKYAGWFDGDLAVWEAMLVKPASRTLRRVDPNQHLAAARLARDERLFLEPAERTILSNGNQESYPVDLVAHAQLVGEHLGGQQYLKALAQTIVKSARNEQDAACRLIVFVQRSIFRDPVSQPLTRDGGTPDSLTTLLSARGRCSHTASLLVDVFGHAGLQARMRQLTNHVIAEVLIDGRWVIADADVFKNGVIPVNRSGEMLSMDDLEANPYQIDRFPPTGWWIRPGTRFTLGAGGGVVEGYVDALDSDERGFVSGYYVPVAQGYPPPVPVIRQFRVENGRVLLEWSSSKRGDAPVWYRVRVGTTSRAWTYDDPGDADEVLRSTAADVVDVEIDETRLEHAIDAMAPQLYASVTAVNDRVQLEPDTFFWPSEEATFVE